MSIKNSEVLKQIEGMLQGLKQKDEQQYNIILALLQEVFIEYNTGKNRGIDKRLYDLIDAEVKFIVQKG